MIDCFQVLLLISTCAATTRHGYRDSPSCRFYCTAGVRYETGLGYYAVGGDDCTNHNARAECGGCVEQPLKDVWLSEGLSRWFCNGDGIRREVGRCKLTPC
jgi:hypothetical protein